MPSYNPQVIIKFAEQLYQQARWIVVQGAVVGGLFAFVATMTVVTLSYGTAGTDTGGLGLVIGAVLGGLWGSSRAFTLKLQAQTALCQVEIEKHARHTASRVRGAEPTSQ